MYLSLLHKSHPEVFLLSTKKLVNVVWWNNSKTYIWSTLYTEKVANFLGQWAADAQIADLIFHIYNINTIVFVLLTEFTLWNNPFHQKWILVDVVWWISSTLAICSTIHGATLVTVSFKGGVYSEMGLPLVFIYTYLVYITFFILTT